MANASPRWRARIDARAKRASNKPGMRRYPRRFILFGPRVVRLEMFLRSEAARNHSLQKDINRLTVKIHDLERGVGRRQRALEAAAEYIDLLKARVRAYHPDYGPEYGIESKHRGAAALDG